MNEECKALVIGGGVSGLCTAYYLAQLLGKDQILRIRLDGVDSLLPVLSTETDSEPEQSCRFVLADGSRLVGQIYLDTPSESSRVLDKLNLAARFVAVISEYGIDLIQKRHIVRVY